MLRDALQQILDLTPSAPLMVLALLVSSLGFYRLVYFVSLGYGFSDTLAPRSFLDYASIELAVWQK